MPNFSYEAYNTEGEKIEGIISAKDAAEVLVYLKQNDFLPINIREKKFIWGKHIEIVGKEYLKEVGLRDLFSQFFEFLGFKGKVDYKDFVIFLREFATLIKSGINVITSLELLAKHCENRLLKKALAECSDLVYQGYSLDTAFSKYPEAFSNLFVNMIRAGIIGGNLTYILDELADYYERELKIREKVITSLTYPVTVFIIAIAGIFFLVNYIFPGFVTLFGQLGTDLPWPTRILMSSVNFARNPLYILLSLAIILILAFAFYNYLKTPLGRMQLDTFKLRLPIIGNIFKQILASRFSRTVGCLYSGGIQLSKSFELTASAIDNEYFKEKINQLKNEWSKTGLPIHKIMESKEKVFPNLMSQMVAVGEEAGNLDIVFKKASYYFEENVMYLLDEFILLLEPILVTFLGGMVLFMMLSLFLPLYGIVAQLKL